MNSAKVIGPRSRTASRIRAATCSLTPTRVGDGPGRAPGSVRAPARVSPSGRGARMRRVSEEIRKAASVIAARDGRDGLEVLVLERGAGSRFLPGYVAFPGGSTDPEDLVLAERWFGTREEAARACAVRELFEEVGLALTAEGLTEASGRSLDSLSESPPSPDQLPEIVHWVAPELVPVRFDARYFATASPGGLTLVPDGGETADAWWASPRDLLEEWRTERRKLYWPTYFTMQRDRARAATSPSCWPCASIRASPTRTTSPAIPERPSGRTDAARRPCPRPQPRRPRAGGHEHVRRRGGPGARDRPRPAGRGAPRGGRWPRRDGSARSC